MATDTVVKPVAGGDRCALRANDRAPLAGAASSSQTCSREHLSETTTPAALDCQADQRACDQCGKLFTARQHTGGSRQRFCTSGCRQLFNKERQRSERTALYAGRPALPAIPQAEPSATPLSTSAVGLLPSWETGVLDIAGCDRSEFVLALQQDEIAGTRPETWPPEIRVQMDREVGRWVDQHKQTLTVRAMTVAAPKHDGVQSCVMILHHVPRK